MNIRCRWVLAYLLVPVIAGALFLSACSGGTNTSPTAVQQTAQPTATQAPAPAPASTNAMVQEHETGAEVTLLEAKRTGGDSLTVKWRYRNTSSKELKLSKGGSSWLDAYQLTSEAFLIDPLNKKKYLVITDDQRYPLASKHGDWQGVKLDPGQSLSAWAKFPAPPAEVQKVTVTIVGVPPFEDVPIVK